MKAVFFEKQGGPEVLVYGEIDTPTPKADEVLIKIKAAAVNRLDLWTRKGWPGIQITYPHITGADGAGTIFEVGKNVTDWKVGDRVVINANIGCGRCEYCLAGMDNMCKDWHLLGETIRGTYAEFVTVPARCVYPIPEGFEEYKAAAASLVFQTAWHSLVTRANIRPGEKVLIIGASGGVNTACIQIAKLAGAVVYVIGSSSEKLEIARSLGADFLIDRSQEENWSKSVYLLTNKRGVDVVVDNVGTTFPQSFRATRKGGRILTVGNTGGARFEIDNRFIFGKHLQIIGSTMGTIRDFSTVMDLVFAGKLSPVLDRSYPLKDAQLAHERMEKGEQRGKITLEVGE